MKGWKLIKPYTLSELEIPESNETSNLTKVKITKSLVTLSDVLRYNGDIETENIILGSAGIGIVSDTSANLFDLEKGKRLGAGKS